MHIVHVNKATRQLGKSSLFCSIRKKIVQAHSSKILRWIFQKSQKNIYCRLIAPNKLLQDFRTSQCWGTDKLFWPRQVFPLIVTLTTPAVLKGSTGSSRTTPSPSRPTKWTPSRRFGKAILISQKEPVKPSHTASESQIRVLLSAHPKSSQSST